MTPVSKIFANGDGNSRKLNVQADTRGRDELNNPRALEERRSLLGAPNNKPLTAFVDQLREETGRGPGIPHFDPADGGVLARVLFVMEAPGPKAVRSGFVSCDNPDQTAKNMWCLLREAAIPRHEIAIWNIVPWYIGTEGKIRPANRDDIREGVVYLRQALSLLQRLECLVYLGRKAGSAAAACAPSTNLKTFHCPHPSPVFVNRRRDNPQILLNRFQEVARFLAATPDDGRSS